MTVNELSQEDFDLLRDSANRFFSEQLPVAKMREIRDQLSELSTGALCNQEVGGATILP